jgi:GMP synthase-like glutamine amidotransferase
MAAPRPLRVQVFQHVHFEGLGSMEGWFAGRGHRLSHVRFFADDLPAGEEPAGKAAAPAADWLIVLGGPMGVHDEKEFPWLKAEKAALRAALERGAAVLGICLGAQLMAHVLGAEVKPNAAKEIGWFPVDLSAEARASWLGRALPERFTPFHWHGDTFGIPAGAVPLGSSRACANQGFLWRERALGLQFHPEVTPASLAALSTQCAGELAIAGGEGGRFVQDAETLRAGLAGAGELNAMMAGICLRLESLAACV